MKLDSRITLAVEELMLHPQFTNVVKHFKGQMPTALSDQHAAAARHTQHIAGQIAGHLDGVEIGGGPDKVPGWLRLGIIEAWIGYCTGTADTCLHSPTIDSPQPVTAAAWRPGLVVCPACVRILCPPPNSVADRTCDGCGHICANTEAGDPIYPSFIQLGSLIYQFGVCSSCGDDAVATAGGV